MYKKLKNIKKSISDAIEKKITARG